MNPGGGGGIPWKLKLGGKVPGGNLKPGGGGGKFVPSLEIGIVGEPKELACIGGVKLSALISDEALT